MFIFDATAVAALFRSHPYPVLWWDKADAGEATVVLPVGAMLDAAHAEAISAGAWEAVLLPPSVEVHDLTETIAVEIGPQEGALHVRHCMWEAHALGWPIVTAEPDLYPDGTPLLTF